MSVRAFPLASELQDDARYRDLFDNYVSILKGLGIEVSNTIKSASHLERVDLSAVRVAIIIFLTGGTSRLAKLLAKRVGRSTPLLLVAHGFHNSLPSALSTKAALSAEGHKHALLFTNTVREESSKIRAGIMAAKAVSDIASMRVVVLAEDRVGHDEVLPVESRFGLRTLSVRFEELRAFMEELGSDEVEDALARLRSRVDAVGYWGEAISAPIKLYLALKGLLKRYDANAVAVDCYPFIARYGFTPCIAISMLNDEGIPAACEADLRSLVLLRASLTLAGKPGWIANLCGVDGDRFVLAHCTVATELTTTSLLLPHFETGRPVAISGTLKPGAYVIAAVSRDCSTLALSMAELLETGMLSGGRCRTQAVLRLKARTDNPLRRAVGNHHVVMPLRSADSLVHVAELLGMKVVAL